jgi:hypothetical protein
MSSGFYDLIAGAFLTVVFCTWLALVIAHSIVWVP